MTLRAEDTFFRVNQSGLGTASDGETWTLTGASASTAIVSDEGVFSATGGDTYAQLGVQILTDQIVQCRIAINNAGDIPGLQARFSSASGSTCYKLLYYAGDLHINKSVAGTGSNLANYGGFTLPTGTYYQWKLECVGTTIQAKVWLDGTSEPAGWMLSVTDSSIASGGFALLANSGAGSGIAFDHFSVDDTQVAPLHEIQLALGFLAATLGGDPTLAILAPGGVWRAFAPPETVPVYVIFGLQSGGNDTLTINAYRLMTNPLYQVKAVGPAADTAEILAAAGRIDVLLKRASEQVTGGLIGACFRESPLQVDELVNGELWTNVGGLYRLQIQQSS